MKLLPLLSLCLVAIPVSMGCRQEPRAEPGSVDVIGKAADPHSGDKQLLEVMVEGGEDLTKPRELEFFFYLPSQSAAHAAASEVSKLPISKEKGFKTTVEEREDKQWLLLVVAEAVIDEEKITGLRGQFEKIAAAHGGEFDGWTASPSKE